MNICQDNMRCKENPEICGYSIECSCFDKGKDNYFIAGIDCPNKWKEIDRAIEIGNTDKPIETSEFPVYKPNCNLTTCRYNANGKCENEEKRKECVEVSRKVLCLEINDNDGFYGTVEKTGQMIRGEFEVHHCAGAPDKRTFEVFGKLKDFSGISKMYLWDGEILEVYKADGSNRLIEV